MFYRIAFGLMKILFLIYFRFSVKGRENIPQKGGAVIAANHTSYLDPPAVGIAMPRRLNFMAKEDLFKVPILAYIIRGMGAFPVRPASGDFAALKNGLKILADGQLMGIFPQGRRAKNDELALRGGAVFLALKAQVPIIPVAVLGSDKAWGMERKFPLPKRVKVLIGKPIIVPPLNPKRRHEQMAEANAQLEEALQELLQEDN